MRAQIIEARFPRVLPRAVPRPALKGPPVQRLLRLRAADRLAIGAVESGIEVDHIELGMRIAGFNPDGRYDFVVIVALG